MYGDGMMKVCNYCKYNISMFLDIIISLTDSLKSTDFAIKQAWVPNYARSSNQARILGCSFKLFKAQLPYL